MGINPNPLEKSRYLSPPTPHSNPRRYNTAHTNSRSQTLPASVLPQPGFRVPITPLLGMKVAMHTAFTAVEVQQAGERLVCRAR